MIKPHGNKLVDLQIDAAGYKSLKHKHLKRIQINNRNVSDCEMLGIGAYSPLTGFMNSKEVNSVLTKMKLATGLLWPIPIVLHVNLDDFDRTKEGEAVLLVDANNKDIALLKISERYTLDLDKYCKHVFLTTDTQHPGVAMTHKWGNHFLAGDVKLIKKIHTKGIDATYFLEPKATRVLFKKNKWDSIVAFQTRNPIHRAHEYLLKCALENHDGLLIHPLVGETKADDVPPKVRMKCYEELLNHYFNKKRTILSVMPGAMRYAGPREAILHLIIRQNYGCTHMIIGRDHAGVGTYYGTYDAQALVKTIKHRLKIQPIFFENAFYCKKCHYIVTTKTCSHPEANHIVLSGTKVREMLTKGQKPPSEFTRSKISDILIQWGRGNKTKP